jgi:hypothetical protein
MLVRHNARHSPRPSMKCEGGGVPHRPFAGHHGAENRGSPTLTSAGFDMMGMIASASDQFISAGYCLTGQSVRPCAPVSLSDLKVNQHVTWHCKCWPVRSLASRSGDQNWNKFFQNDLQNGLVVLSKERQKAL